MAANVSDLNIECHPLKPFLPKGAKLLMLGSFPPPRHRWSIDFFYPNIQNDMWRIFGFIFYSDKDYFYDASNKCFRKELLETFLQQENIAVYDTATRVRRLRGNASDQFLEIVEETNIALLLSQIPQCHTIACTGQKSAEVVCHQMNIDIPKVGAFVETQLSNRPLTVWRMPSSSRSYPLPLAEKAKAYRLMLSELKTGNRKDGLL